MPVFRPPWTPRQQKPTPIVSAAPTNYPKEADVSEATSVSLLKTVGKKLAAAVSSVANLQNKVGKTLGASVSTVASVVAIKVKLQTASATSSTASALQKTVGKPLVVAAATTSSLVKKVGKGLNAASSTSASATKKVSLGAMNATVSAVASALAQKVKLTTASATVANTVTLKAYTSGKLISASVSQVVALARNVGKPINIAVGTASSLTRKVGKPLGASVGNSVSLAIQKAVSSISSATVGTVANVSTVLGFNRTPSATSDTVASLGPINIQKTFEVSVGTSASASPTAPFVPSGGGTGGIPRGLSSGGVGPTSIFSMTPSFGPYTGGYNVSIHGSGFTTTVVVTIGGVACTNVEVLSTSFLVCQVPQLPGPGSYLVVLTPIGSSPSIQPFYFYAQASSIGSGLSGTLLVQPDQTLYTPPPSFDDEPRDLAVVNGDYVLNALGDTALVSGMDKLVQEFQALCQTRQGSVMLAPVYGNGFFNVIGQATPDQNTLQAITNSIKAQLLGMQSARLALGYNVSSSERIADVVVTSIIQDRTSGTISVGLQLVAGDNSVQASTLSLPKGL